MALENVITENVRTFSLFPKKSIKFIEYLGNNLPVTSGVFFECTINESPLKVDFSQRFVKEYGDYNVLVGWYKNLIKLKKNIHPKWLLINKFFEKLLDYKGEIPEVIFLEFDEFNIEDYLPVPCIFLQVNKENILNNNWVQEFVNIENLNNHKYLEQLKATVSLLPDFCKVFQIGNFLSRINYPLRLNIEIPVENVNLFLKEIKLHNIQNSFLNILEALQSNFLTFVTIDLNISKEINMDGGIEIKPNENCTINKILSLLVEFDWMISDFYNPLIFWPAISEELNNESIINKTSFSNWTLDKDCFFVRRINHIKLQVINKKKIAKVYLYEGYGWI